MVPSILLPSHPPESLSAFLFITLVLAFSSGRLIRGRIFLSSLLALLAIWFLGLHSSYYTRRYLIWQPYSRPPQKLWLVLAETRTRVVVVDAQAPRGRRIYPKSILNAHFHNPHGPPCHHPHARRQIWIENRQFRISGARQAFLWWPLLSTVALIGMLVLDGTVFRLLAPLIQSGALLFIRHPLPSTKEPEALKQRIDKLMEEVRVETALAARLREQLRRKTVGEKRSE